MDNLVRHFIDSRLTSRVGDKRAEVFEPASGAAIFTRDGEAARAFAHGVQAGMVGVNIPIPVPMAFHSYGGWKHPIFGDHAMHGHEGMRFFTKLKTVTQRWPEGGQRGGAFAMPTMG